MTSSASSDEHLRSIALLLQRVAGKDPDSITLSTRLIEDLNLESLEMMELLFEAEDEFGLTTEIPTERLESIKTIGDLLGLLLPESST